MLLDKSIKELFTQVCAVGSRITCNPASTNTDIDYLCICKDIKETTKVLDEACWEYTDDDTYQDIPSFRSFRQGNINLIVTDKVDFYNKFILASDVAKKLNLLNKSDRIDLFQAILYSKNPYPLSSIRYASIEQEEGAPF